MKVLKKKVYIEDYLKVLLDELKEINETLSKVEEYLHIATWENESKDSDIRKLKEQNKKLKKQLKGEKNE